ncbi:MULTISPECIES: O-antigen ligase family protein [Fusobacterium]|jgi:membrane protein|uniref:O-antigen ligase family protein n=1 Tax=Fusobacterium TaxID=848 RepID=UPI0028F0A8C2|nr:O-antigen ligase family protein [Fusobacterium pseudoperiodonticum]MED5604976.1 O-antigen ligase family protein [Fusobacterium pseudoperiodonticum]
MTIYLIAQEMTISHNFFNDFKKYFNIIILMLSLADILFLLNIIKQNENYSMGLSYSLLFYLSVYSICKKKIRKIDYLKILYMILFIFRYGSRGAILAYLILIFMYLLNKLYFNKKYKLLLTYIISSMMVCYVFFKTNFVELIFQKIAELGVKSRTIILFQQKEIHLSGRGEIYKNVYNSILKDPFSVKGIFSDFFVTGINNYSHNIILELLYQFGIILGGFILFLILLIFFSSIYHKQKSPEDNLLFIFAIISVVHLMISGTLWESVEFWTWIGLYLKQRNKKNYILSSSIKKIRL